MVERNILISILIITVLFSALAYNKNVFAFGPIPPSNVFFHIDIDTANGFEEIGRHSTSTPVFVLKRGSMGEVKINLTSLENVPIVAELRWGGQPPYDYAWSTAFKTIPTGIIYNFEPNRIILSPNSSTIVTMRIASTSVTELRGYNMTIALNLVGENISEELGYSTVLEVIEGILLTTHTRTITSYKNQIVVTSTQISTSTTTITSSTTLPSIETVTDSSLYVWAVGATVIAIILPLILVLSKRNAN